MKKLAAVSAIISVLTLFQFLPTFASVTSGTTNTANQPCPGGTFLGLTKWDAYLPGQTDPSTGQCLPVINSIGDVWLIVAAVIEMLLRIAGIAAVIMVIFGGIKYTTSMGSPEAVNAAKNTITYSVIGLVIAVSAAFLVTFIATSFGA